MDSALFLADRRKCDLGHFPRNIYGSFVERFNRISLFCQVALERRSFFFFCWGWLCSEIELLCAGELGSPCLDFKSSDALSFYEAVEIGALGAVGEYVIGLLFRLSFSFSLFYRDFRGFSRGL